MIDICMNFCTCYYDQDKLVTDRKLIARNYLTGFFLLDLAASIPYDLLILLFGGNQTTNNAPKMIRGSRMLKVMRMVRALRIVKVVRIFRLRTIMYRLEEVVQSQSIQLTINICKYLAIMVYLAHWEACLWYWIGRSGASCTWVKQMAEKEPAFAPDAQGATFDRYLVSLYWAITTMSTVGYGDIVPCNENERLFSIVSMFTACGMFGYVLGSMQRLLAKFGEERLEFDRLLIRTMREFKSHNVSWDLQHRVRKYLEHNFENKTKTKMDPE